MKVNAFPSRKGGAGERTLTVYLASGDARLPLKRHIDSGASRIPGSMARSYRSRSAPALGAAVLVAFPFAALSQVVAPSQVTPETFRPAATNAPGGLLLSGGAGLQTPAGAERLSVIVGR